MAVIRFAIVISLFVLAGCGSGGDSSDGAGGASTGSPSFAGIGVYIQQHDPAEFSAALAKVSAMGMKQVRLTYSWNLFEPRPGELDVESLGSLVSQLQQLKTAGIKAILLFARTPCWAADTSLAEACIGDDSGRYTWGPPDPAHDYYGEFLGKLVSALRQQELLDAVEAWEIWNEANVPYFWGVVASDDDPEQVVRSRNGELVPPEDLCTASAITEEGCQLAFVPEYMPLLLAANRALDAAYAGSGETPVVLGFSVSGMDIAYLEEAYRYIRNHPEGRPSSDYFDAIAIHPYSNNMPLDFQADIYSSIEAGVERILALMDANGDRGKPLYFTEFAWSNYDGLSLTEPDVLMGFPGVSQSVQKAYLAQLMGKINGDWKGRIATLLWSGVTDDKPLLADIEGRQELTNEASFYYQGLYAGANVATATPRLLVDFIHDYHANGGAVSVPSLAASIPESSPLYVYREAHVWSFPSGKRSDYRLIPADQGQPLVAGVQATGVNWKAVLTGNGYRLQVVANPGLCLASAGSGEDWYDNATTASCDRPETAWKLYPFQPGLVIQNVQSGRCLTYSEEYFADTLTVQPCDKYNHGQIFRVEQG